MSIANSKLRKGFDGQDEEIKLSRHQNTYHGESIYDCKYLVVQIVSGLSMD